MRIVVIGKCDLICIDAREIYFALKTQGFYLFKTGLKCGGGFSIIFNCQCEG